MFTTPGVSLWRANGVLREGEWYMDSSSVTRTRVDFVEEQASDTTE
jgi:hypothetical protein